MEAEVTEDDALEEDTRAHRRPSAALFLETARRRTAAARSGGRELRRPTEQTRNIEFTLPS